jgi:hypothetical protein
MIQTLALKIGIALAILAGACGATWFASAAHYEQQYTALKSSYEQAARDQQLHVAETIASNQLAAKDIDEKAKVQIGSMAATISDLSVRLQHSSAGRGAIAMCAATAGPAHADAIAPGRAIAPSADAAAVPAQPALQAAIDPDVLADALDTGIEALRAELLFRQWAKRVGAAK